MANFFFPGGFWEIDSHISGKKQIWTSSISRVAYEDIMVPGVLGAPVTLPATLNL